MSQTEPSLLMVTQHDLKQREELYAAEAQRNREKAFIARDKGFREIALQFDEAAHRAEMKVLELKAQRFDLKQPTDVRLVTVNGQRV